MRIAFYAPLKSPLHPVPSGDRLMARLLMRALTAAGHRVDLASDLRAYLPDSGDAAALSRLEAAAGAECDRLSADWAKAGAPDLWFCYHPYYKSPDLIGPALARRHGLPWVSAEASLSARRTAGIWAQTQASVQAAITGAQANFALTARDRRGIAAMAPGAHLLDLPPFLDLTGLPPPAPLTGNRLVTIAMMRDGDKMDSFRALAAALACLPGDLDWTLAVAGDGPGRAEVAALFPPDRLDLRGQVPPEGVAALLSTGAIYVWPGCGEAYGLAYLEAQAAGLPVVACATAGVPEVVADGETGFLSPPGDPAALAANIARMLGDAGLRRRMGQAARARVLDRHSLPAAAARLAAGLTSKKGAKAP